MNDTVLISIHIPKTAGSTLLTILEQVYQDSLQLAYKDGRGETITHPRCYHGHLVMNNFGDTIEALPDTRWITFVRDPLRSAISLYHYGVKRNTIDEVGLTQWLTGTEPFCWPKPPAYNHNRFTNWIRRTRGSWDQFDIVGVTEYFDESIQLISQALDWPHVEYETQNAGEYSPPELSDDVIEEFRRLNAQDYKVYDEAVRNLQNQKSAVLDANATGG